MKKQVKTMALQFFLITVLIFSGCLLSSFDNPGPWVKLGSQTASFISDYDEFYVTGRQGTFSHLRLKVDKSNVHLSKVVVMYRHGNPETVNLKKNIHAGNVTRAIDLEGGNRIIHKVMFYYNTHVYEGRRAKITLWGKH